MALTLGTNCYIELDAFKAWCDLRNYNYADYDDAVIESAIVIASIDYLDVEYTFIGTAVSTTQQMQLPTDLVTIASIENAAAQAAWQQLNNLLFVDQAQKSINGQVKMVRKKLDTLETETEYEENTQLNSKHDTSKISASLRKYTVGNSGFLRVL